MGLDIELHQQLRYRLSSDKFYLIQTIVEAVGFGYEAFRKRTASLFILI